MNFCPKTRWTRTLRRHHPTLIDPNRKSHMVRLGNPTPRKRNNYFRYMKKLFKFVQGNICTIWMDLEDDVSSFGSLGGLLVEESIFTAGVTDCVCDRLPCNFSDLREWARRVPWVSKAWLWKKSMAMLLNWFDFQYARWFNVFFSSPSWRSPTTLKGQLNHPFYDFLSVQHCKSLFEKDSLVFQAWLIEQTWDNRIPMDTGYFLW